MNLPVSVESGKFLERLLASQIGLFFMDVIRISPLYGRETDTHKINILGKKKLSLQF
jgi:hypothetical protein